MLKIYILIVFIVICGFSNANNIGPAPNSSSLAEMIKGGRRPQSYEPEPP
jgi:hypothetical protein